MRPFNVQVTLVSASSSTVELLPSKVMLLVRVTPFCEPCNIVAVELGFNTIAPPPPAALLFNVNMPALFVRFPVNELAPDNTNSPVLVLVKPADPVMAEVMTALGAVTETIAGAFRFSVLPVKVSMPD